MRLTVKIISVLVLMTILASCEKKDPVIPNDEELITTVHLYKTFEVLADSLVASFRDLDGAGGNEPEWTHPVFKANSTYLLKWVFLNESVSPADNISSEIYEEAAEHQIFYIPEESLKLDFQYMDQDENGNPLGLNCILHTGEPSSGNLRLVLRHLPDKFAIGVSDGEIANAGGESDIELDFDVVVE